MIERGLAVVAGILAVAGCDSNAINGSGDRAADAGAAGGDASADANAHRNAADANADAKADVTAPDGEMDASPGDGVEAAEGEAVQDAGEEEAPRAVDAGVEGAATQDAGTEAGTPCSSTGASGGCAPPSCQASGAGTSQCGASNESCCTSLPVPDGTYYRTYKSTASGPTNEADPATVSGLRLDKYLVTVGRFAQFVAAWSSGWTPPGGSGKHAYLNGGEGLASAGDAGTYEPGWNASDDGQIAPTKANLNCQSGYATWGNGADLPINCTNWFEAYAFCIWDGGFLPSEAEWEFAAAGGSQQLEYPWGATAPGTSNEYAIYDCDYPSGAQVCNGASTIAPVGTALQGAGLWGQFDLAGELWEWALDWDAAYASPCTDCASLTISAGRTARGGSSFSAASSLLAATRAFGRPADRNYDFGFRCARSP